MSIIPYGEIVGIRLRPSSSQDNASEANVMVLKPNIFYDADIPEPDGIYSLHMGTTEKHLKCSTCYKKMGECPGHFGAMKLNYPVLSPMFMKLIMMYLKIICFNCGRVIIDHRYIQAPAAKRLSAIVKQVRQGKKMRNCIHCGVVHPYVDKLAEDYTTILIKKFRPDETDPKKEVVESVEPLYPHFIQRIFNKITMDTVVELGQHPECHPKILVLKVLKVPPTTIRPNQRKDGNKNPDDLTIYLQAIFNNNNELLPNIVSRDLDKISDEEKNTIRTLNMAVFEYIRGTPNMTKKMTIVSNSRKKLTSITARLPGKFGRIRRNLNGRRVTSMARSYITCDTTLRLNEIGVPQKIAQGCYAKMVVREYNYKEALVYYMNGSKTYPGSSILKKPNGQEFKVDTVNKTMKLEYGDVLMRHFIDGDVVDFNRAPSLESSSISSPKIRIDRIGRTIKMNIAICPLYNADFDGDQMNIVFLKTARTMHEIESLSGINTFFISYKTSSPKLGLDQDSLSATPQLTYTHHKICVYDAMQIMNRCKLPFDFSSLKRDGNSTDLSARVCSGRNLISMLLKQMGVSINYQQKANISDSIYNGLIKFDESDKLVRIVNGEHISGILDKKSIGATNNSLFHIINNQYNSFLAMEAIHHIQQIGIESQLNTGMSVSIRDFILPDHTMARIRELENKVIYNSYKITNRLYAGNIVPPLGITVDDYYEDLQLNELRSLGDELYEAVFAAINPKYNNLFQLIAYGAKGSIKNYCAITSAIGQLEVKGRRIPLTFSGRSCSYFALNDPNPVSRGYIGNSLIEGLSPCEFIFYCMEARNTLTTTSLQTPVTGDFNRRSVKNFESIIVNNMRQVVNAKKIIQLLYGGDGVDTRHVYRMELSHCAKELSVDELDKQYHARATNFPKFNNAAVQKVLDDEFAQLMADRTEYIYTAMRWETLSSTPYTNVVELPMNVRNIIENKVKKYPPAVEINPLTSMKIVSKLCEYIPYIYFNSTVYNLGIKLPEYVHCACRNFIYAVRVCLCVAEISKFNISESVLNMICEEITMKFLEGLVDYGRSIGILASQSYSEPITQIVLDSKHTSGVGGKRVGVSRVDEILGVKPLDKMTNPTMELHILEQFESNKFIAYQIVHNIEMITLDYFKLSFKVFYEKLGEPIHPSYLHEEELIREYVSNNRKPPGNLINYCIRIAINKYKLVEKQVTMAMIAAKLKEKYPQSYVMFTPDTYPECIIRLYLSSSYFKPNIEILDQIKNMYDTQLKHVIIRGVKGIINAQINEYDKTYIDADGTLRTKKAYRVYTSGVNIRGILKIPNIDKNRIFTDSIMDTFAINDIIGARNAIVIGMRSQTATPNCRHLSVYADEMTFLGYPTSVDRHGSTKRNKSFMLRLSDASTKEVIETAATNAQRDTVSDVSACLIMGKNPKIGVCYNELVIDPEFIGTAEQKIDNILDEL